jgi:3-oxoadipate enol-lactonase
VRRFIVALVMAIPGAMRIVVPDTGHLMYIENPDEFFKRVSSFLIAHGS